MFSYIFFKLIFLFVTIYLEKKKKHSLHIICIKILRYIICKSGKEKDFAQTMLSLYNELYELQIFLQRLMLDLSANIVTAL